MILGLDLGQTIGWVLGDAVGPLRHGIHPMQNTTDLGLWLRSGDEFWQQIFGSGLVTGVAIEQPFLGESYYPARKLLALLGAAYYWGSFYGLSATQFMEVPIATGKKTLTGYGKADKNRMVAAAKERGYVDIETEHEADALGVWWVYQFGRQEPIRKPRSRSSKAEIIQP